jgi:hypothetical protein
MKVYLSGGMEYAGDHGAGWRDDLENWIVNELGHDVFNPVNESRKLWPEYFSRSDQKTAKKTEPEVYNVFVREIVRRDSEEVANRADYLICYWDAGAQQGAGTQGEVTIARFFGKPVYLVSALPYEEIPGWIMGCATNMFSSFDRLKSFLIQTYRNGKPSL